MAELTTQEQKDFDILEGKSFQYKFADQLDQMSSALTKKIANLEEELASFTSPGKTLIWKEKSFELNNIPDMRQPKVDSEGNKVLDELGEEIWENRAEEDYIHPTESEVNAIVDQHYQMEVDERKRIIEHSKEEIRLIGIEQDFRLRGIVTRDPIGTTYYQSFQGSDSNNGTTNATPYKYLNAFTETARSAGDVLICRRPRGGVNPSDLGYSVAIDGTTYGGVGISGAVGDQASFTRITNDHSGSTIKTPLRVFGKEPGTHTSGEDDDNGFIAQRADGLSDPRDRSRGGYWRNRYYSIAEGYRDKLTFTSDGTAENPIVVMADYENEWGDFIECGNGKNGDDGLNGADNSTNNARGGGYIVEFGSKIIRRSHDGSTGGAGKEKIPVHSYITPGDCIFIGSLTTDSNPKPNIAPNVGDDPYEHSYIVRDVNYDKIVLWQPYKGEMAGEKRTVVSMGYQPRWRSIGYSGDTDDYTDISSNDTHCIDAQNVVNWVFQGITWTHAYINHVGNGNHVEARKLMNFTGWNNIAFKDCMFIGRGNDKSASYPYYNKTEGLWYIYGQKNNLLADKCVFLGANWGIYDYFDYNADDRGSGSTINIKDCIFNGFYWDRVVGAEARSHGDSGDTYNGSSRQTTRIPGNNPTGGIRIDNGYSHWSITDTEFVNWKEYHIWVNDPANPPKMRNLKFLGHGMDFVDPTVNTIYEAHENLGLRWARPAFAGAVSAYSDTATANTNGGDPTVAMNDVTNNATSGLVGTQTCKRVDTATGDWVSSANDYGRKWYDYVSHNIPDGSGGYSNVNDHDNDMRSYADNYQGAEATGGSGVATRSQYRRHGGYSSAQNSVNNYTGMRRNENWNRYDNSTHKYRWTNHFGATALVGAVDVVHTGSTAGKLKFESGLEKWNSWWCNNNNIASPFDESSTKTYFTDGASHKVPKGQPFAEELYMEWYWFTGWRTAGYQWGFSNSNVDSWNDYLGGGNDNNQNHNRANHYNIGNSYAEYVTKPRYNISVHTQDYGTDYGSEQGNGPGWGIGCSPWFGSVFTYWPNWYVTPAGSRNYNFGGAFNTGHNMQKTVAVQDYMHLYLDYDKDLGRSADLYPEVYHPMLVSGGTGDSVGVSKNIMFQHPNKTHTWSENTDKPLWKKGYGQQIPPIMETVSKAMDNNNALATILRSGGGSYVIKVYPTTYGFGTLVESDTLTDLASTSKDYGKWYENTGLMIFEYPFYLSTNARTYTVYLNRGLRTGSTYGWASDPTHKEVYLEMEYIASKPSASGGTRYLLQDERRKDRSTSGLAFQSGTGGWEALALTVTPETEGVGYLRLWWKKPRESNRANCFYVDPKVEVT